MSTEVILIGTTTIRLLVPSRRKDGGIVDRELRSEWDSKARAVLEKQFEGATPFQVRGSYQHPDGRTTREEITVLTSAVTRSKLDDQSSKSALVEFAAEMCQGLGQDKIFLGWGDESYLIGHDFKYGDVPVVRFVQLTEDSQIAHLTMGWAGIDSPEKILQVLSLDGWTLPESHIPVPQAWKLCGYLRGEDERRAWAWSGTTAALTEQITAAETDVPREGDLIFWSARNHYLNVALVGKRRLVGPRDLRLSHGQLNPVTRNLLFRILRREWSALEADLRRKPLDQRFFPKLQKVRAAVETQLLDSKSSGATPDRQSDPPATRMTTKKRKRTKPTAAEEQAFRQSVLIIGRMMFLRFLIQKGSIPGGMESLRREASRLGDTFFSKWLTPLWFDVLNVPEQERATPVAGRFGPGFPYLNGGLFIPRPGERDIALPARFFDESSDESFLRLFEDFEFSLNEHDGSDDSLKVDPSFFGRALESFNPDVEKKRHGVHYTPKPIARALAAEAIVTRVAALADLPPAVVYELLGGRRPVTGRQAAELRKILGSLRIIDPAVGSGVLLWAALRVLLDLDSACDGILGGRDGYQPGSYEWGQRSRHFVCNCLYGIDISDEAIELSRLRLWLAVALSEDSVSALPDLELNICRGDSLLGDQRRKGTVSQMSLVYDDASLLQKELRTKTLAYLEAGIDSPLEQRRLRGEILQIRRRLLQLDQDSGTEPPLNWNLFFPHVFGDPTKNGFDIVIANPPYIRVQQVDKKLVEAYRSAWPTIGTGSADLSFAFIELALKRLAAPNGGQIAFIQPNFRHHDAGVAIRSLLTGHDTKTPVNLRLWVDFDDAQVFPTASNYVAMLFAERTLEPSTRRTFTYSLPSQDAWEDPDDSADLSWLRPKRATHENPVDGEWLTVSWDLRTRVQAYANGASARLGDIADIDVGVQTSSDAVFLFESGAPREDGTIEVGAADYSRRLILEAEIVKRCVKGSAGDEYWLLFPYDGEGRLFTEHVLRDRFPLASAYLTRHRRSLEGREGGAFKDQRWYRYGRTQGCEACMKPKVIVPSALREATAIIDRDAIYALTASGKGGGGAWAITPKQDFGVTLDVLAQLLTSDHAWDHYRVYGSPQKGGWRGVDRGVLLSLPLRK